MIAPAPKSSKQEIFLNRPDPLPRPVPSVERAGGAQAEAKKYPVGAELDSSFLLLLVRHLLLEAMHFLVASCYYTWISSDWMGSFGESIHRLKKHSLIQGC